jgi:hypothetical protein
VPVHVSRAASKVEPLEENTIMLSVNAFGGLLILKAHVERGDSLLLTNKSTLEGQECRVVNVGPVTPLGAKVGVEFVNPAPDFWRIYFPTVDPRSKHHRRHPERGSAS